MKVTFKDVGQGDSIILEWKIGEHDKVGIIDCNKKSKSNPVRDHIKDAGYKEIEFIILSHPHSDHYSGMNELLSYIEEKNIIVKKFGHSLFILGQDFYRYLIWAEIDTAAMKDLHALVKRIGELRNIGVIRKLEFISENWSQPLSENIVLKCLSPSQMEAEQYMSIVKLEPEKNKRAASASANYLSTMFSLIRGENYYLLTADTEASSLERLLNEMVHQEFEEKSLQVGQLPHHGSKKNRYDPFWEKLKKHDERHAVASAGYNLKYQHPNLTVLRAFFDNGYTINCTNIVHGGEEFSQYLKELKSTSDRLDTISELIDNYKGGEKVFTLS